MAVWEKHTQKQNSTLKACLHPPQIVVHKEQLFAARYVEEVAISSPPKFPPFCKKRHRVKNIFWLIGEVIKNLARKNEKRCCLS